MQGCIQHPYDAVEHALRLVCALLISGARTAWTVRSKPGVTSPGPQKMTFLLKKGCEKKTSCRSLLLRRPLQSSYKNTFKLMM